MTKNALNLAMTAMNHPHALSILDSIHRLIEADHVHSSTTVVAPDVNTELDFNLHRCSELQSYGVNTDEPRLLQLASQYPERLSSAINAWLKWVSYTKVEYPTWSLIRAIEQDWKI
jgi:hypothetical protein